MNEGRENISMQQLLMEIATKFVLFDQDLLWTNKFQAISIKSL